MSSCSKLGRVWTAGAYQHLSPTSSTYFERRLRKVRVSEIHVFGGGKVEVEGVYINGSFFSVVGMRFPLGVRQVEQRRRLENSDFTAVRETSKAENKKIDGL